VSSSGSADLVDKQRTVLVRCVIFWQRWLGRQAANSIQDKHLCQPLLCNFSCFLSRQLDTCHTLLYSCCSSKHTWTGTLLFRL